MHVEVLNTVSDLNKKFISRALSLIAINLYL